MDVQQRQQALPQQLRWLLPAGGKRLLRRTPAAGVCWWEACSICGDAHVAAGPAAQAPLPLAADPWLQQLLLGSRAASDTPAVLLLLGLVRAQDAAERDVDCLVTDSEKLLKQRTGCPGSLQCLAVSMLFLELLLEGGELSRGAGRAGHACAGK
jgi:hypothetical protein